MNPIRRKMYYIALVPLLFFINIMVSIAWWDTTPLWAVVVIFCVFVRIAERYSALDRFNFFMKRIASKLFPDVYEKGILTNSRFLLIVVPCFVYIFMNMLIAKM